MAGEKNQQPGGSNQNELSRIEKKLIQISPNIFDGLKQDKKTEILRSFSVSIHQFRSGPLPDPEEIAKYNQEIPNGAERIMAMAEKQQDHRIDIEKIAITEQLTQSRRGQTFGLIIGLTAIIGGVICIMFGHEWSGGFIGGGGITGLVSVFVIGKRRQSRNLEEKN